MGMFAQRAFVKRPDGQAEQAVTVQDHPQSSAGRAPDLHLVDTGSRAELEYETVYAPPLPHAPQQPVDPGYAFPEPEPRQNAQRQRTDDDTRLFTNDELDALAFRMKDILAQVGTEVLERYRAERDVEAQHAATQASVAAAPPAAPAANPMPHEAGKGSHIDIGATITGGVHDYGDGAVSIGGKFSPEKITCGDLRILRNAVVTGDISSSGTVHIDGTVTDSQISAKEILIYANADVTGGSMKADTVGIQVGAQLATNLTTKTMRNEPESELKPFG
jgi:cytoskeletal protein CcmA (bactofilin family)